MTTTTPAQTTETNGLAIGSFITAIMGFSLVGLVMGIISLKQCRRQNQKGDGFALAAVWIGGIGTAAWSFFWFVFLISVTRV